jgi:hypothetical protein
VAYATIASRILWNTGLIMEHRRRRFLQRSLAVFIPVLAVLLGVLLIGWGVLAWVD